MFLLLWKFPTGAMHLLWWGLTLKRKCSKLLKRFCTIASVEKSTWTWWKTCESNKPVLKLDKKKRTKTHMNMNFMKKKKKPVLVRPFSGLALTAWEKGLTWNGRGKNIWSSMLTTNNEYHDWILNIIAFLKKKIPFFAHYMSTLSLTLSKSQDRETDYLFNLYFHLYFFLIKFLLLCPEVKISESDYLFILFFHLYLFLWNFSFSVHKSGTARIFIFLIFTSISIFFLWNFSYLVQKSRSARPRPENLILTILHSLLTTDIFQNHFIFFCFSLRLYLFLIQVCCAFPVNATSFTSLFVVSSAFPYYRFLLLWFAVLSEATHASNLIDFVVASKSRSYFVPKTFSPKTYSPKTSVHTHTRLISDCQSLKYFFLTSSDLLNVSCTLSHEFFFIWNFSSLVLKQWVQSQLRANVASFVLQPRLLLFNKIALEGEVFCL